MSSSVASRAHRAPIHAAHFPHRVDRAQRIGDVHDSEQLDPVREQRFQRVQLELPPLVDRRDLQRGAGQLTEHLPGHDVGVVLHVRQQDLVTRGQPGPQVTLSHQVDGFGGAARKDDLALSGRIDVAGQQAPCTLVEVGGLLAEGVHAAVHIGVMLPIEAVGRLDHRQRPLRRCSGVQVDEGLAVHGARQDRKILANPFYIEVFISTH